MASVYSLHSETLNKFYTGSCKDLEQRLKQHSEKFYTNSFTSKADDWVLFLSIDNLKYKQARLIESHIKRMKSRVYIKNLLIYPDIIVRLKEKYEE